MTVAAGRFTAVGGLPPLIPVSVCAPGTTTLASLYVDATSGTPALNPVPVDAFGGLSFFAVAGSYDLVYDVADEMVTSNELKRRIHITVQPDPSNPWPTST